MSRMTGDIHTARSTCSWLRAVCFGLVGLCLAQPPAAQTLPSGGKNPCLDEAVAFYSQQDFTNALARLECAETLEPANPDVFNTRGAILLAQQKLTEALLQFDQAIRLAPSDSRWYGNRGNAHKNAGNYPAAMADFDRALTLDPSNIAALYSRGNLNGVENRLPAAIADYSRVLALDANYERAWYNRGYAWMLSGKHSQAIADLTRAIQLNASRSDYYNQRAMAYLQLQQLELALADIDNALRLEPGKQNYLANRELIVQARAVTHPIAAPVPSPSAPATAAQSANALATARIGNEGGVLESAGQLSIDFQPGALAESRTLTLSQTMMGDGIQLYQVDSGNPGHLDLQKPAKLSFKLPHGENPADIRVIAEISEDFWWVLPSAYDPASGTITAATTQFSGVGTLNTVRRGAIGLFGGMLAGGVIVITSPVSVPATISAVFVGIVSAAGAAVANPLWAEATRMGYGRHFSVSMTPGKTNFTFHFNDRDFRGEHDLWTLGLNKKGEAISATHGSKNLMQIVGLYQENLQGGQRAFGPHEIVDVVRVPERLWLVVKAFIEIKLYFSLPEADFKPPNGIEVLLTDQLPYTRGSQDDGEWDGKFLKININSARSLISDAGVASPEAYLKLKAYAGHEYWHAIWDHHGYAPESGLTWLNEALATAFETEVAPGFDGTFVPYPGSSFAEEAERGLLNNGSYYALWPIGRYLLHTPGETRALCHARILEWVTGKRGLTDLSGELGLWNSVIESLSETERQLPDPVIDERPWHGRPSFIGQYSVRTGWSVLGPKELFEAAGTSVSRRFGRLELGKNQLPAAPPLAYLMRVVKAELPQIPGHAGAAAGRPPLIVRREPGYGDEQLIAYQPAFTPGLGPNIGLRRSAREQQRGKNRLLLRPDWLLANGASNNEFLLPLGVLRIDELTTSPPEEPILVYFLLPPQNARAQWRGAAGGRNGSLRVEWDEPDLGKGLTTAEVLAGYRIVIEVGGEARELTQRLIEPGKSAVELTYDELFPLDVDVPTDPVAQASIGLYSVDKEMKIPAGQRLTSPLVWAVNSGQQAAVPLITLYCRADCSSAGLTTGCKQFPMHIYRANQQLGLESLEVPYVYTSIFQEGSGPASPFRGGDSLRFQQFTNFPYAADGSFGRSFSLEDAEVIAAGGIRMDGKIVVSGQWQEGKAGFKISLPDISVPDSQFEHDRRGIGATVNYACDGNPD